jgi:hypothetical protein
MPMLYKRQTGLIFACVYFGWILVDNFSAYFVFHGQPPIIVVAMKDILIGLFVLGGVALKLSSPSALQIRIWTSRDRWFYGLSLIAIIYFIVDIFRAGNLAESTHGLRDFLAPFIVLLIGTIIGSRKGFNARFFVTFVAVVSAIVMIMAIYQYLTFSLDDLRRFGIVNQEHARGDPATFLQLDAGGNVGGVRGLGVFDTPLVLGIFSVMVIFNSWVGFGWSKGIRKILHCGAIAVAFIALYISFSRSAQLGLVVATLILAKAYSRRGWLVAIVLVAILLPIVVSRTFVDGLRVEPSTLSHIFTYARAAELLRAQPFGYGISFAGTRPDQTGFDGDYLNVLMNAGPIGLILFLAAFRHFYRQAKHFSSTTDLQTTSLAIRGMLIAYTLTMVALMIHTDGGCRVIYLWIGVLLGYGTTCSRRGAMPLWQAPKLHLQTYSGSEARPGYL